MEDGSATTPRVIPATTLRGASRSVHSATASSSRSDASARALPTPRELQWRERAEGTRGGRGRRG